MSSALLLGLSISKDILNLWKILFLLLLLPTSVFGQLNFYRQYSNNGTDIGEGLVQLEDSSYVLCGSSSSFANHAQAFLMKVDSLGNFIWSQSYGGLEQESARRVLYQENYGFYIAGHTNSMGAGAYDFYLAKTSLTGDLEWERTFGGPGWDRVRDAILTSDTGVVMVGERSSEAGHKDWCVIRTDQQGDTVWTKSFGGSGDDVANSIRVFQDSLLVIGGTVYNEDSLMTKAMLVFMHQDGTVLDSLEMGENGSYELNDLSISNDSIQAIGNYKIMDTSGYKITFFNVQINGSSLQVLSNFFYNQTGDNYGQLITSYNNGIGRYTAVARENQPTVTGPGQDQYMIVHSPTLAYLYSQSWLTGPFPDIAGQLIATSDGGAAMVGWRGSIGPGEGTVFLMKIGPNDAFPVISVSFVDDIVAINDNNEIEGLSIYPNPTDYQLIIKVEEVGSYLVSITNILGQTVYEHELFGTDIIDVSQFSAGSYLVSVSTPNGKMSTYKIAIR